MLKTKAGSLTDGQTSLTNYTQNHSQKVKWKSWFSLTTTHLLDLRAKWHAASMSSQFLVTT